MIHHNIELVKAAGIGYFYALRDAQENPADTDTWFECGPYDLNICGKNYTDSAPDGGLIVYAYPAGWTDDLPDALFSVTIETQTTTI